VQLVKTINDYEIHNMLYQGIVELITSPDAKVAQTAAD
jgi:hypothetical protein